MSNRIIELLRIKIGANFYRDRVIHFNGEKDILLCQRTCYTTLCRDCIFSKHKWFYEKSISYEEMLENLAVYFDELPGTVDLLEVLEYGRPLSSYKTVEVRQMEDVPTALPNWRSHIKNLERLLV